MRPYIKLYIDHFGLDPSDFIPCEITGRSAVDISHNEPRGMGGSKTKDVITNLMALTREAHIFLEQNPDYYWWFQLVHYQYMVTKIPYYQSKCASGDPIFNEIINKL